VKQKLKEIQEELAARIDAKEGSSPESNEDSVDEGAEAPRPKNCPGCPPDGDADVRAAAAAEASQTEGGKHYYTGSVQHPRRIRVPGIYCDEKVQCMCFECFAAVALGAPKAPFLMAVMAISTDPSPAAGGGR